jgi:hypothetical protein
MAIQDQIQNSEVLTNIFGRWPSFHDAEVLRITLDRDETPCLEALIHVFEMTSQVEQGALVLKNHVAVTFRFIEICVLKLEGFNHQNVLAGLWVEDVSNRQMERIKFEVSLDGIFGVSAHFQCNSIRVESLEPYVPDQR